MDEIEQRLRTSSETCIKNYEAWRKDQKNIPAREMLQEAVHELRKVASRLEIEMAVSERDQMSDRPLLIPPHRSSQRPRRPEGAGDDMPGDDAGNHGGGNASHGGGAPQGGGQNRPPFSRNNNNAGRGRRPMPSGGGNRTPQGE